MANFIPSASEKTSSFTPPPAEAAVPPLEQLFVAQERIAEANQAKQEDLMTLMQKQIEQLKIENINLENDKELLRTTVAGNAITIDALQRKLGFEAMQAAQDAATINEQKEIIAELRVEAEVLKGIKEIRAACKNNLITREQLLSTGIYSPFSATYYADVDNKKKFAEMVELYLSLHELKQ